MPVPSGPGPSTGADFGPCQAWEPADCAVWPTNLEPVKDMALMAATEILWLRTKRRFGTCEISLRPCRRECGGELALAWLYGSWLPTQGGTWGWPYPALVGGRWFNLGCGICADSCSCTILHQVELPYPVADILEVKVDGQVLVTGAYRVDDWRHLVRLDGGDWPTCFPAGTLVTTDYGQVPIEDIEAGDMVLTHKGRWRRVSASGMTGVRQTVKVKGRGDLTCTADHPVWARELLSANYHTGGRKFAEPEWTPASGLVGRYVANAYQVPSTSVHLPEGMTSAGEDFWKFVGFWLGDGYTNPQATRVAIDIQKQRKVDYLAPLIPDWRCSVDSKGFSRFRTVDPSLASFLRDHFGAYAAGKRIPSWMLGAPETVRRAFLDGYVNSDGCVDKRGYIQISTASKASAIALRILAGTLGISAGVYRSSPGVKESAPKWTVIWRAHLPIRSQSIRDDRADWAHIRSVTASDIAVPVYDLTVDEDESFVADGFVVHNCQDLNLPDTAVGTWSVTLSVGEQVPQLGLFAVDQLARQIALGCIGSGACALPAATLKDLTRQGVAQSFVTGAAAWVAGFPGMPAVQAFLQTYNPTRSGVASIYSIDRPRARITGT